MNEEMLDEPDREEKEELDICLNCGFVENPDCKNHITEGA